VQSAAEYSYEGKEGGEIKKGLNNLVETESHTSCWRAPLLFLGKRKKKEGLAACTKGGSGWQKKGGVQKEGAARGGLRRGSQVKRR